MNLISHLAIWLRRGAIVWPTWKSLLGRLGGVCVTLGVFITWFCVCPRSSAGVSLRVYDLDTGREVWALRGHDRPTSAIAISPDGTLAITASLTSELRLWSLRDGREVRVLPWPQILGYTGAGMSLQFVNGTNLVLVGRAHSGAQLWSLASNTPVLRFEAPFRTMAFVGMSSDQQIVRALSGSDVTLATWGYPQGNPMSTFSERWMQGYRYVSLARNGKPRSWWESDTGEPWPDSRPVPPGTDAGTMDQAALSPDGRRMVTYGTSITAQNSSWVHLWDIESGKLLWHHPALDLPLTSSFRPAPICAALAFSPDSQTFAYGGRESGLVVQDVDGGGHRQEWKTPRGSCARLIFHPDGQKLLTWGDKTLRLWNRGDGRIIHSFAVPVAHCLAVTPDGRFVVVGGDGESRGL